MEIAGKDKGQAVRSCDGMEIIMPDKFDYAEPTCPLCDGRDFYYPKADSPRGYIPTGRITDKVNSLFEKNNAGEAHRLLLYWRNEARSLGDRGGELSMESELVGYYRKAGDRENGLRSVKRALELVSELGQEDFASGATVLINCATAYKAFSMPEEAMPLYLRAEEIYKKTLPKNDTRFGALYNNMGLALTELGRFEDAEYAYYSALAVMDAASGGEAESAVTYINLAHMYEASGETEFIGACMQNAYSLLKSEGPAHDGNYAYVLENCAPSFGYFGNVDIYKELTKEIKDIRERS